MIGAAMANGLRRANALAMGGALGAGIGGFSATTGLADPSKRSLTADQIRMNYPGFTQTPVNYNPKKPDQTLASITQREQERFEQFYRPAQRDLIGSMQDSSIVDDARQSLTTAFDGRGERTSREMRRYGLSADPATQAYMERNAGMDQALHTDSTMNEARLEQKERNDGLRRNAIDIGRGFADASQSALGDAASNQAQRKAANASASAARSSQNIQLGATALMAAMFL
jgi:hypothetical protein